MQIMKVDQSMFFGFGIEHKNPSTQRILECFVYKQFQFFHSFETITYINMRVESILRAMRIPETKMTRLRINKK